MSDLGIGVYRDEHGNTPMLDCVVEAEKRLFATQTTKNGQTYAMVLLRPPAEAAAPAGQGQRVIAVVDSSSISSRMMSLHSSTHSSQT